MNNTQELAHRFFLAMCRIDEMYYSLSKRIGVKENVLVLLTALKDGKPRTQKQICQEWLTPKTTINTGVKECVEHGYITFTSSEDGREKLLVLTDLGKDYVEKLLEPVNTIETAVISKIVQEYSEDFIKAIEMYSDLMQDKLADLLEK